MEQGGLGKAVQEVMVEANIPGPKVTELEVHRLARLIEPHRFSARRRLWTVADDGVRSPDYSAAPRVLRSSRAGWAFDPRRPRQLRLSGLPRWGYLAAATAVKSPCSKKTEVPPLRPVVQPTLML